MNQIKNTGISNVALNLFESVTHGTRMRIAQLNKEHNQIIDLSIGTLDAITDTYIDNGVIEYITYKSELIHQFAPVKGFDFLLKSIADRIKRLHHMNFNSHTEIMVTPGGIKGSIAVIFHTMLDPNDEVILPLPNWPHYADMIKLHGGKPVFVQSKNYLKHGLDPIDLDKSITNKTKLIILGDCINPTGKVHTTEELMKLAKIIMTHNINREKQKLNPIYVLYDCPYESHILKNRPQALSSLVINDYLMRDYVINVTGPGKTYGMHGDRIGYIYAPSSIIEAAANVQVNLNSFACTYGQIACFYATHERMDQIAVNRAIQARKNTLKMIELLQSYGLSVHTPDGGYFIFVDFSSYAKQYEKQGFSQASQFLLDKAHIATISGVHFAKGYENADIYKTVVRINCGRNIDILTQAAHCIKTALNRLN